MKQTFFYLLLAMAVLAACKSEIKTRTAGFSGEDLLSNAQIVRDKETKKARFESKLPDSWELYYGPSVDSIDFSKPILTGKGVGNFPLNVSDNKRAYFELITPKGSAILAERHLPMTGGFNFRDIGGYKTQNGHFVKWGKILRSDDLSTLTDADMNYLSNIPLLTVIDYRSQEEIAHAKDKIPASVKNDLTYSISPGNVTSADVIQKMDATKIDAYMQQINVEFVTDSSAIAQFRKMFAHLQDPTDNTPLLYHCTAGKDRTGMSTALILYALGVDDKTVMDDYLLSNQYIEAKFAKYVEAAPQLKDMFIVKSSFLQSGIDAIKKNYGNVDNFLTQKLDVNIDKFRELYLY